MNLIELFVFLLLCAGLGFLGHLFSPRLGWLAGAIPAVAVLIGLLIGSFRKLIADLRQTRR
jgi:glycerol-3-phosphate acyltransferase PlsY